MVDLKGKIYYLILYNISILFYALNCSRIAFAVYAVLMLYNVYVIVIYNCTYVRNIIY